MTTTYTNITLFDVEPDEAAEWLVQDGYVAAVSPRIGTGDTIVYENTLANHADDEEPLESLLMLASEVSYELGCMALLIIVDEDAALIYTLYSDGEVLDSYGVRVGEPPEGGDAEKLVEVLGIGLGKKDIKTVRRILNRELDGTSETASARLTALLESLKLSTVTVGYDYDRLLAGETPAEFTPDDLLWVGEDDDDDEDAE